MHRYLLIGHHFFSFLLIFNVVFYHHLHHIHNSKANDNILCDVTQWSVVLSIVTCSALGKFCRKFLLNIC